MAGTYDRDEEREMHPFMRICMDRSGCGESWALASELTGFSPQLLTKYAYRAAPVKDETLVKLALAFGLSFEIVDEYRSTRLKEIWEAESKSDLIEKAS